MTFEYDGRSFDIHVQKVFGLGWCWAVSFEGTTLTHTMNEDGKRSRDRALANARQWVRNNV